MSVAGSRITVGPSAAVRLADFSSTAGGSKVFLKNADATYVASLGPSTVTSTSGYTLIAGATLGPLDLASDDDLWAIVTGTNSVIVHVFRYH
jgi:hypothetical protein